SSSTVSKRATACLEPRQRVLAADFHLDSEGKRIRVVKWKKNRPSSKATKKRARTERRRKVSLGAKSGSHAGPTVGIQYRRASLLQLVSSLRKARIPFQIIGMGAGQMYRMNRA